jgi:hypothetical protein
MSAHTRRLATDSFDKALGLRMRLGYALWDAVPIYDLVEKAGAEVRFTETPTMEAMFFRDDATRVVLVSSLRPAGRKAFSAAHELGHMVFGHGVRLDEVTGKPKGDIPFDPIEFVADTFAGALLMPKVAVERGFAARGWKVSGSGPLEFFVVAGWLGVGYETLVRHMQCSLGLINETRATTLLKKQPLEIRTDLYGARLKENLYVVDAQWKGRPVDIEVGDVVIMPAGSLYSGDCVRLERQEDTQVLLRGLTPGIGRLAMPAEGWSCFVRVSRRSFVGRNRYKHLEEIHDEE